MEFPSPPPSTPSSIQTTQPFLPPYSQPPHPAQGMNMGYPMPMMHRQKMLPIRQPPRGGWQMTPHNYAPPPPPPPPAPPMHPGMGYPPPPSPMPPLHLSGYGSAPLPLMHTQPAPLPFPPLVQQPPFPPQSSPPQPSSLSSSSSFSSSSSSSSVSSLPPQSC